MPTNHKDGGQPGDESKKNASWTGHLRMLIRNCTDIPSEISEVKFARVDERKIDETLLRKLTEHCDLDSGDDSAASTRKRRSEALSPYLDRTLICVSIVLPGVRYTIEIDPEDDRIVHWEWQAT